MSDARYPAQCERRRSSSALPRDFSARDAVRVGYGDEHVRRPTTRPLPGNDGYFRGVAARPGNLRRRAPDSAQLTKTHQSTVPSPTPNVLCVRRNNPRSDNRELGPRPARADLAGRRDTKTPENNSKKPGQCWTLTGFRVGEEGVEPSRPSGHTDLNRARLPFRHSPVTFRRNSTPFTAEARARGIRSFPGGCPRAFRNPRHMPGCHGTPHPDERCIRKETRTGKPTPKYWQIV